MAGVLKLIDDSTEEMVLAAMKELGKVAEKRGFEPLTRCREHAFQAGALSHSATSPL